MNEIQQLVEQIQTLLTESAQPQFKIIERLNQSLIEIVTGINSRLRRCDSLLEQGLRSEAIQLAEQEPDVLTAVSYLDFAEWEEWTDLVRQAGLQVAPEPLLETAAELNQSYTVESALEGHLKQHRLLALARAPLSKRLMVMRKIMNLDADNPVWQDDIEVFERQRFEQIRGELQQASQQGDADCLANLEQELTTTAWFTPPPKKLLSQTRNTHRQCRIQKAEQELKELEPKLTEAFAELDLEKARPLRNRWNALLQIAGQNPSESFRKTELLVQPALNWLDEEDQLQIEEQAYQQALFNLEQAISEQRSAEDLQELYHAATRTGRDLPTHLYQRYTDCMQYQETRSRRRFVLMVSSTIVTLLLVGLLLGYLIQKSNRQQEIATHTATLEELISRGKLPRAEEYRTQLQPQAWIMESPEIQQLSVRLDGALEQEQGRARQFQAKLNEITEQIHPEMNWEQISQAESATSKISPLAVTAEEKVQLGRMKLSLSRERSQLQKQVNDQFKQDVDKFTSQIQSLNTEEMVNINNAMTSLDELLVRKHVSPSLKNDLPKLKVVLQEKQNLIRRNEDLQRQYMQISNSVGNFDRYQKSLEEYIQKFPGTNQAIGFKKIIEKELPLWKQLKQWELLQRDWNQIQIRQLTPQLARSLLDRLKKLEAEEKAFPVPDTIQQLRPAVEAISARTDMNQEPAYSGLLEILEGPLYSNLNMVQTLDDKRYYTLLAPRELGARLIFDKFNNISLTRSENFSIDKSDVLLPGKLPDKKDELDWSSPQSKFTRKINEQIPHALDRSWETTFLNLLEELYNDKQMEPILKYQLLRSVLEIGCQGSLPLQQVFAADLKALSDVNVDPAANWIDPEDSRSQFSRKQVINKLKTLSSPLKKQAEIDKQLDQLSEQKQTVDYEWIGWLSHNAQGEPLVRFDISHPSRETGDLLVIAAEPETDQIFQTVGTMTQGKIKLNSPRVGADMKQPLLLNGRAVFCQVYVSQDK
ncbi:hypothetical protein [Gimesia sp.]|uniref:hypothetical protein n=1 Tax=Gimesia sp. TaxID=2024833 RepID=UPI003A8FF28F